MNTRHIARTVRAAVKARGAGDGAKAAELYENARQAAVDAVARMQSFDPENIKALEKMAGHPIDTSATNDPALAAVNVARLRELFADLADALAGESPPEPTPSAMAQCWPEIIRHRELTGGLPTAMDLRKAGIHPGTVSEAKVELARAGIVLPDGRKR